MSHLSITKADQDKEENSDIILAEAQLGTEAVETDVNDKETINGIEIPSRSTDANDAVPSGPQSFIVFDKIVFTIVDQDEDNRPVVEFSAMKFHKGKELQFECGICPKLMQKEELVDHRETHLVPGTNRYGCIYCTKSYKMPKQLAGHARRHIGIRPYVCEECMLYFCTKEDFRIHNIRHHKPMKYKCELCGQMFAQNTTLMQHRRSFHEQMKPFQCMICSKLFNRNYNLKQHIRNVHEGKRRKLVCSFCGMQFRTSRSMALHRKLLHFQQETYSCEICKMEFKQIHSFDAHKRSLQCRNYTQRKQEKERLQLQQHTT